MKLWLDRFGIFGLFTVAILSPCCFPLFSVVLSALGLSGIELFGQWTMEIIFLFVIVSVLGTLVSLRRHRNPVPLIISVLGALIILYSYYFLNANSLHFYLYSGMFCLLLGSILNYRNNRTLKAKVVLKSTIICPQCSYQREELMPLNACQYFYKCTNCHTYLKPHIGDCCVFCSYGTMVCPPMQLESNCCKK